MDLTLTYRALASGQIDLIAGDATAGLIKSLDLFQLEDNRRYFPPYDAVPVARASVLLRYPRVRAALERLAHRISAADMDVNHAREEMNLSEWGTENTDAQRDTLLEVCRQVKKGAMPLSSYTLLHRGAALSAADVTTLCTWSEQARKELRQAQ